MNKKISDKLGLKDGMRSIFIDADEAVLKTLELPELDIKTKLTGQFDYMHLFVKTSADFHKQFPKLAKQLNASGMLWVSWPKARQGNTDLTLTTVIEMGYTYGLVESKAISIDAFWSALKFTNPRKGKLYNNSYGKLPDNPL